MYIHLLIFSALVCSVYGCGPKSGEVEFVNVRFNSKKTGHGFSAYVPVFVDKIKNFYERNLTPHTQYVRNSVVVDYPFELADDKKLQKRKKKFNRRKTKTVFDLQNSKNKLRKVLKINGVEMTQKHENEKWRKKSKTKGKQDLTFRSIKRKNTLGDIMKHYISKHKDRPVDIRNFFRMHV
ncbi:uncharacterized protein LOC130662828 [Hydractinia symbiolongicarpus]|uniref:uncharacterized protein LOC130662828 n=1 Tax=Hydractinia symbiolongicarpus TaxID=13093 RepID=UPI00254F60DF|nr:uncharacterized protein LOC130662828 [Hydractinia symbiolongicarpus]